LVQKVKRLKSMSQPQLDKYNSAPCIAGSVGLQYSGLFASAELIS
jgi:hypothetical protein